MGRYIFMRLVQSLFLLVGVSMLTFAIIQLAPGGFAQMMGESPDATAEDTARLTELWGLDQPVHIQYLRWAEQMVQGNFGDSLAQGRPIAEMIGERLPATIFLNIIGLLLIYVIALPIGIFSAVKQYSKFDHIMTFVAFLGQAMPAFFFAMLLIYYVGMQVEWIPLAGMATIGVEWGEVSFLTWLVDRSRYLIMPLVVIVFGGLAGLVRFMRASMLDVIHQDYVRTARAKGLSERVVIFKHTVRNALLPIVTSLGFAFSGLLGGSVVIESIFAWPGVGLLAIQAIFTRDYPVIMAFNLIGSLMLVLGMLVADILYVVVDPRIKY
ncbi:MAG: ABC transporter permease [Firmicutes bacterium]|nr:ABC transporter permease [Dethiobacter sp.]MBS3889488.1 ABC transporter permease [Bacillota bacterium]